MVALNGYPIAPDLSRGRRQTSVVRSNPVPRDDVPTVGGDTNRVPGDLIDDEPADSGIAAGDDQPVAHRIVPVDFDQRTTVIPCATLRRTIEDYRFCEIW